MDMLRAPGLQRASGQPPRSPGSKPAAVFVALGPGARASQRDLGLYGLCCRRVQRLRTELKARPNDLHDMYSKLGLAVEIWLGEVLHKRLPPWNTESTSVADDVCLFNPPIHSSSLQLASVTVWPVPLRAFVWNLAVPLKRSLPRLPALDEELPWNLLTHFISPRTWEVPWEPGAQNC